MIEIFFFSLLSSVYYISAGIFFSNKILDQKIDINSNIYKYVLYGGILLGFLALILNFFVNLGKNTNTLVVIIFLTYVIFSQKIIILKKILLASLIIAFSCSILLSYENTYRPDAGLYHLPFINILNNEKIIIGLSNIHFRFGHTSIAQYLSALNYNWILSDKGIVLPSALIYLGFLFYLINEIKNTTNKNILLFNLLLFSFLCFKLNRYSDFGNDAPAHIYYFFLTSLALNYYENMNKERMGEIIGLSAYLIFNKITLFLGSMITLVFLFFKKQIFYFKAKLIIFVTIFTFAFFLKNFLISGCIAFPIEKTCISDAYWFDAREPGQSIAKITMLENEAWTKGWVDQKKDIKNFEEYLSDYKWIKIWAINHGQRTINKLIPFLTFVVIIFLTILVTKNVHKKISKKKNKSSQKRLFYYLLFLNFLGIILWFIKFPVFRYGYSYIILFIIFLIMIILFNKIKLIDMTNFKKKVNYFLIFAIFILISKNFIRIASNYNSIYFSTPWPKIYSDNKMNNEQENVPIIINEKIAFYYSNDSLCYYNTPPCTHILDSRINKGKFKFEKKHGYKIFYYTK